MPVSYPLDIPTEMPADDPQQYIPLLMSSIEGFLQLRAMWRDEEYAEGFAYMEELKSYIWELFNQGIITVLYPEIFAINILSAVKLAGTTLTFAILNTTWPYHIVEVTPAADNNALEWSFFAREGRYDIHVLGGRGTNYGRVTIKIDGNIAAAEAEMYNAGAAVNIDYVFDVLVSGNGMHALELVTLTKAAASSGQRFIVSSIYGKRTGDA